MRTIADEDDQDEDDQDEDDQDEDDQDEDKEQGTWQSAWCWPTAEDSIPRLR